MENESLPEGAWHPNRISPSCHHRGGGYNSTRQGEVSVANGNRRVRPFLRPWLHDPALTALCTRMPTEGGPRCSKEPVPTLETTGFVFLCPARDPTGLTV